MKYSLRSLMIAITLACVALALYVLSDGPATGLWLRDYISTGAYETFYAPLSLVGNRCEPIGKALRRYETLFFTEEMRGKHP
jgi:hypothetical protein